jgi:hypothetical protein
MIERCVVCGNNFPKNRMDVTEAGLRCFSCSQAAEIVQSEARVNEAVRSHNRGVEILALLGFGRFRVVNHCAHCNEELPQGAGLFSVALPPTRVLCDACGTPHNVSFMDRVRWMHGLIWKLATLVAIGVRFADLRTQIAARSGMGIVVSLLLSATIGYGVAVALCLPAAVIFRRRDPERVPHPPR